MNIFKVLNKGNSRLHETSISALLAYFLDPNEDHGLGDIFLRAFPGMEMMRMCIPPGDHMNFLSFAAVELEKSLDKHNTVDTGITLRNGNEEDIHHCIIENKIRPESVQKEQLAGYYEAARSSEEFGDKPMTVVFLTPDVRNKEMETEFSRLAPRAGDHKVWLHWKSARSDGESIQQVIRKNILQREAFGEIPPIHEYVKHTLKAFAVHLDFLHDKAGKGYRSGGKIRDGGPKNIRGPNAVLPTVVDDKNLIRYDDHELVRDGYKFLVRDANGDKVPALPVFRKIMKELDIPAREQGSPMTTYECGSRVFRRLLSRNNDKDKKDA